MALAFQDGVVWGYKTATALQEQDVPPHRTVFPVRWHKEKEHLPIFRRGREQAQYWGVEGGLMQRWNLLPMALKNSMWLAYHPSNASSIDRMLRKEGPLRRGNKRESDGDMEGDKMAFIAALYQLLDSRS